MMAHSTGVRFGAFFQNVVGHGNFAEVVQVSAAAKGDERFVVESEMLSKIGGFAGEAFAVSFGVGVARLRR